MKAEPRPSAAPRNPAFQTLGDVLYADKAASRVPEKHWGDLVRSIAAGDQQALHALYARTDRIVFTLIMRITGNRETAEELTVDVFYDVWRRAATYDPAEGSVIGWILNQARSRAIDRVRYEQRQKRAGDPAGIPAASSARPQAAEIREAGALLKRALQELAPEEREAIETAYFSELTHQQTAHRLNLPLGTVKTRIRTGLSKIREALAGLGDPR